MILPVKGITIFVGPNNSGKSLLLREVEQDLHIDLSELELKILNDYEIEWPEKKEFEKYLEKIKKFGHSNHNAGHISIGRLNPTGGEEHGLVREETLSQIIETKSNKSWFATKLLKWGVVRLDGRSRFNLTNDQQGGDLIGRPTNILMHLFNDDGARKKVRNLIEDAFGLYFVVDPTNLGRLRIRLSEREPLANEQSLDEAARNFHAAATHIKDASNGVQAYAGIICAVCSGEYHTILVDEPEAFLHPPLARKLGKNLANLAVERGGALMASTHSSDFLMGCIQASPTVRVVRLEYSHGKSRARMIDPIVLESFLKRPLMRSANVISGLFHDGVVVCESDNDRAFYSEIYYRMTIKKSDYPSILFVNAQNKQTIKDIMGPLREFGVPVVAVPDIDLLKDGGTTWTDWLKAAQVPTALHLGYGQQRSAIKEALIATGKNMQSDGGIALLDPDDRAAAEQLFNNLEEYGVFTVRRGEVENWLPALQVAGKKLIGRFRCWSGWVVTRANQHMSGQAKMMYGSL